LIGVQNTNNSNKNYNSKQVISRFTYCKENARNQGLGSRAIAPPKFSKTSLVLRNNNKLQSFPPENMSWLLPWSRGLLYSVTGPLNNTDLTN